MKVLVLGGSGFVSRYVVRDALAEGDEVWYVTRGNREPVGSATAIIADRNDKEGLLKALRATGERFDGVIDCICFNAAQAQIDMAVLPEFTEQVVVISTDSLYHPDDQRPVRDENAVCYMMDDGYGGQKRQMELAFIKNCPENLHYTIFRPPHMFGAGSNMGCFPYNKRQPDLIGHMKAGKPIRMAGDGRHHLEPLYAGDISKVMLAAIGNPKTYNEIFCISGPDAIENREYYEILGGLLGVKVTIEETDEQEYIANYDDAYQYFCERVYNKSKMAAAGLPLPKTTLREGLAEQIRIEHRG